MCCFTLLKSKSKSKLWWLLIKNCGCFWSSTVVDFGQWLWWSKIKVDFINCCGGLWSRVVVAIGHLCCGGFWSRVVVTFGYKNWCCHWVRSLLAKGCDGVWSRVVVTFGQKLWWLLMDICINRNIHLNQYNFILTEFHSLML